MDSSTDEQRLPGDRHFGAVCIGDAAEVLTYLDGESVGERPGREAHGPTVSAPVRTARLAVDQDSDETQHQ